MEKTKAVINGSSCVVTSRFTRTQLEMMLNMFPEEMCIVNEYGEMEFCIDLDENEPGFLSDECACFGQAVSSDGLATITILIDPAIDDKKKHVYESLGRSLMLLSRLEDQLEESYPDMAVENAKVRNMISEL